MTIFEVETDEQINDCYRAYSALRPHIVADAFLPKVRRQMAEGFRMVALRDEGLVVSAAGYRIAEFMAWGRVLYVDDLTTLPASRGKGHGGALVDWLIAHARAAGCDEFHLDSGYMRHDAHRLYLNKGMILASHHMTLDLRSR